MPPSVHLEDGLSEDEAVTMALWNSSAFQEVLADLDLSRADLVQAGMLPNPTLSMLIPVGAKPLELTAKYPFEILWQRPRRISAAKLDYERTAQRLIQSGLDLIRDVRLGYADAILSQRRLKLAEELLALNKRIAQLSQARLTAGEASELEARAAEIEVLQTQEQVDRLVHDEKNAQERLRNAIGMGREQWKADLRGTTDTKPSPGEIDDLVTRALASRPDVRAAELGVESAGKRIGLARAEAFTLAAGINSKEVGNEFLSGPALDATIPVLNQNQGGVAKAKAGFEKAARQYNTARDKVVLEVREAHTRAVQARQSLETWQAKILPPLDETVRQAERAYETGNVSHLFVLETSRKLMDGRLKVAGVESDLRRATAELERSVGQKLGTIPKAKETND